MGWFWISSLVFLGAAFYGAGDYLPEVCDFITESNGLIQPILPKNFEMKSERVDHVHKFVVYDEMYFDYSNNRGKYMYMLNGIERHYIFDYFTSQIVQYDVLNPGVDFRKDPLSHVCTTENIEESNVKYIFGYIDDNVNYPRMYTSNEALRFGGKYPYAFNGTERLVDRGILVNKFSGCVYDSSMDMTMSADYYFTEKSVVPSGGTLVKDVIGAENGVLPVPVQMNYKVAMVADDGKTLNFKETVNVNWFQGEPDFNPSAFQIPPWVYCKDYRGRKDMPNLPQAFDTRVQVTNFAVDILGEFTASEVTSIEHVFYYKEKKLARRDYTPDKDHDSDIFAKFQNLSPVSTIWDFNEGLVYITNIGTGRCYIRPIIRGDYFDTPRKILFTEMATPEELFHMQTDDMEYKGTAIERDIEVDVFNGIYNDKTFNATFVKETYFSTKGWHELAGDQTEYGVPIKHTIIRKELDGEAAEGVSTYNFFKFIAEPPPVEDFDVSNCIETQDHRFFAIFLEISEETKTTLFTYKNSFLETAQYYLTDVSQLLSPLRVQSLLLQTVSISDPRTVLVFALVDKVKIKSPIIIGQKGASLEEAILNLQKYVDNEQFAIEFYPPGSKEMTLVPALSRSMYELKASGDLQFIPLMTMKPAVKVEATELEDAILPIKQQADPEVEDDEGMSSGALALLGIAMLFIGVGVGIAVMYLYIRYFDEQQMQDRINLTEKQNSVTEREHVDENAQ